MNEGMYSSATPEWATPQALFDELHSEFCFNLDPCATAENAKCARYFTQEVDGLNQPWAGNVFMNPPYGRKIKHWIKKAWEESQQGALVVCLIPARTDTAWWHDYVMKGEVRFIRGRLRFNDDPDPSKRAPFPSAIVIFRAHTDPSEEPGDAITRLQKSVDI